MGWRFSAHGLVVGDTAQTRPEAPAYAFYVSDAEVELLRTSIEHTVGIGIGSGRDALIGAGACGCVRTH